MNYTDIWIIQVYELHRYMYYTYSWITHFTSHRYFIHIHIVDTFHKLHKFMIFYKHISIHYTYPCITLIHVLHVFMYYTYPCITHIHVLHISMHYTYPLLIQIYESHKSIIYTNMWSSANTNIWSYANTNLWSSANTYFII